VSLERFLGTITTALAAEGIPAMLTGSLASAVRGAVRTTMDVDLVIDPTPSALDGFVSRMEAIGFYASPGAAKEALAERSMFNVIDPESGWKADLIIRKNRPFSVEEFERREPAELLGMSVAVARVEDLVIAKLEWAKLGASQRQLEDVQSLLQLSGAALDRNYLTRWIERLDLGAEWRMVRKALDVS
jgi:hypothetical protein